MKLSPLFKKFSILSLSLLILVLYTAQASVHQNPAGQVIGGAGFIAPNECDRILGEGQKPTLRGRPNLWVDDHFKYEGQAAGPVFEIKADPNYPGKKEFRDFATWEIDEYNMMNMIESVGKYEDVNGVRTFVYGNLQLPEHQVKGLIQFFNSRRANVVVGLEV